MTGLTAHAGPEKFYPDRSVRKTRSGSDRTDPDRVLTGFPDRPDREQSGGSKKLGLDRTGLIGPGQDSLA
ncbi:hypothetical protein TIFTF001_030490 [Ficus carica]|uniref:Uncharacterized protein n=1 Tax=Ficus carica TaxID=3494 RepID=A0AA88DXN4_FICCA|nr:hypothetical protein TIFTF001_030490 [Ficus carica]